MDPITQAAFGAAAAQLSTKQKYGLAALAGTLGGLAPDLDVLIKSQTNPLLGLEYHRHFTHSLAFIPIGGFIVAAGLWLLYKGWAKLNDRPQVTTPKFGLLYLFSTLGYATHGIVDTMTSYGTLLLWPLNNVRYSWDWVSIIDIYITIPLIFGVWATTRLKRRKPIALCSLLVVGYIGFLAATQARAYTLYEEHLASRGIETEHLRVQPMLFQFLTFRAIHRNNNAIGVAHIKAAPWTGIKITEVGQVPLFDSAQFKRENPDLANRVEVIEWFADGYVGPVPGRNNSVGDYRYGRLTTPLVPLWGFALDPEEQTVTPLSLR